MSDTSLKFSSDSKTSLTIAAKAGHEQVAQLLLRSGADVDAYTGSEKPLLLAAAAGRARLVRLLLEHGADVNGLGKGSKSALTLAKAAGHASTVGLRLENGADPYASKWELKSLE